MRKPSVGSTARGVLTIGGLFVAALLLTAASNWSILNWKIVPDILENWVRPILPYVRSLGPERTTVFAFDARDLIYGLVVAGTLGTVVARSSRLPGSSFWIACLPLIAILVTARLSLSWTISVSLTSMAIAPLFILTVAALFWGALLTEGEIWSLLEVIAVVAVVLNLIAVALYPNWSMMLRSGDITWRGLLAHKNDLGPFMVFANTVMLVRLSGFRAQPWIIRLGRLVIFALSLVILWHTGALGSFLAAICVYALYLTALLYLKWGRRLGTKLWAGLAGAVLLAGVGLWLASPPLLAALNRKPTLGGRLPLWYVLGTFIKARLLLGYGFGRAFWEKYANPVAVRLTWHPPHAHNGFVDFALDLGLVGALLLVIFLTQSVVLALSYFLKNRTPASLWPVLLIVLVLIVNLVQSLLGSRDYFYWFLLVLTFSFTLRYELERRAALPSRPRDESRRSAVPDMPKEVASDAI